MGDAIFDNLGLSFTVIVKTPRDFPQEALEWTNKMRLNQFAICFCLLVYNPLLFAIDANWTNGPVGDWEDAANWSSVDYPDNFLSMTYDVVIDGNPVQDTTVTLNSEVTVDSLRIGSGDLLQINPGQSLEISLGGSLTVDGTINANSSVTVFNGTLTSSTVGQINTDNFGLVQVVDGTVENIVHNSVSGDGGILVGDSIIRDVTNNGGQLLLIDATIDGDITNNSDIVIDEINGAFTNATIDGVGSIFTNGAEMTAAGPGSALTFEGEQTFDATGTGIDFVGGSIIVDGTINVNSGITIRNGSLTSSTVGQINTDNFGLVQVVDGTVENIVHNSVSGDGGILVGDSIIRDVTNNGGVLILENATLDGHIVNAATISANDPATVGSGSRLTMVDGKVGGDLIVNGGGRLDGGGLVEGNISVHADGIIGSDMLATQMDVFGQFSMEGLMQMELAGTSSILGEYDQYNIFDDLILPGTGGNALLDGILEMSFISSYTPTAGDSFDLFTADDITNNGIALSFLALAPTLDFTTGIFTEATRDIFRLSFVDASVPPVPVPGAILLFVTALLGLAGFKTSNRSGH